MAIADKKFYVIGVLPGFNSAIDDSKRSLEKELLHNITFLDLVPVSYSLTAIKKMLENDQKAITNTRTLYTYSEKNTTFHSTFKTLLQKYCQIPKSVEGLRLILSSDSVFNETFQIDTNENDLLNHSITFKAIDFLAEVKKKVNLVSPATALEAYEKFDVGNSGTMNFLRAVFDAKVFGVNFALPKVLENADYRSDLNVFIKLTSPTGHLHNVKEYIVKPLLALIIAASPISLNGLTYGFPFMWKAINYGNITFNAAYISQLTVTRGSVETSYSDDFLPLSVDIRMTISSLSDKFASILHGKVDDELYNVGLYTPAQEAQSIIRTPNLGSSSELSKSLKLITINI